MASESIDLELLGQMASLVHMRSPSTGKRQWFAMRLNGNKDGKAATANEAMRLALTYPVPARSNSQHAVNKIRDAIDGEPAKAVVPAFDFDDEDEI